MRDLHTLPLGSKPNQAIIRNNGPNHLVLERYKIRELAEGWFLYRDACEWSHFNALFHHDAYVCTAWTGRVFYREFIKAAKDDMDRGIFMMHRVHGSTTDIHPQATRAVTKMKVTITQRFNVHSCEVDVECDCRFVFFWTNYNNEWKAHYVRIFYEKDKMIPVDPRKVPDINDHLLETYPLGYRYLGYCQETSMGVQIPRDMPTHMREYDTPGALGHTQLCMSCKWWVEGEPISV